MATASTASLGDRLSTVARGDVDDLLYREAELLDRWELDEWLALYVEGATYVVPSNDIPHGDPNRELMLIDDNWSRMRARVERLNSRKAHREYPHSRTSHQVTNVRVRQAVDGVLPVRAEFTVWRFRGEQSSCYVGHYEYELVQVDGELRIRSKRAVLAMTTLRAAGDVAIIL